MDTTRPVAAWMKEVEANMAAKAEADAAATEAKADPAATKAKADPATTEKANAAPSV
jgi:hypothetical protein